MAQQTKDVKKSTEKGTTPKTKKGAISIAKTTLGPMDIDINNILAFADNARTLFDQNAEDEADLLELRESILSPTGLVNRISVVHRSLVSDELYKKSLEKTRKINPNVRDDAENLVIGGERRLRAHLLMDKLPETIPCEVRHFGHYYEILMFIDTENHMRKKIAPMDRILSIERTRIAIEAENGKCTLVELSKIFGLHANYVATLLAILKTPLDVQKAVNDGTISTVDANNLAGVEKEETRQELLDMKRKKGEISGSQWSILVSNVAKGMGLKEARRVTADKAAADKAHKQGEEHYFNLYVEENKKLKALKKQSEVAIQERDDKIADLQGRLSSARTCARDSIASKIDYDSLKDVGAPPGCMCSSGLCTSTACPRSPDYKTPQ